MKRHITVEDFDEIKTILEKNIGTQKEICGALMRYKQYSFGTQIFVDIGKLRQSKNTSRQYI